MNKDTRFRFYATALAFLTVAAVVFGWVNLQKEHLYVVPWDGIWWVEHTGALSAERVEQNGPGFQAGIREGDRLVSVNDVPVHSTAQLSRQLFRAGPWSRAGYSVERSGRALDAPVILAPIDRSINAGLRLIALIYLGIGLYVLLRRWAAPKSFHFYVFCLASFILYAFHYTGKLNTFDWIIYWSNVSATLLQPALFLHFVLTFPERKGVVKRHPWLPAAVYVPGLALLAVHISAVLWLEPSGLLLWQLDRAEYAYLGLLFVAAAAVLWHSYGHAATPILRQQMKWVTRGTILAVAPFTLFYVLPYILPRAALWVPAEWMKISVLSLIFLPLTFGYAIFRYRLMDVDVIFKRGMAYTLAAAAVAFGYFLVVAVAAEVVHTRLPSAGSAGLVVAIMVTALCFEPLKNWILRWIDRFFYRTRYDYRRTLIDFGRDLSSETDLEKLLSAVVDRLSRTLMVDRVAIFMAQDDGRFVVAKSSGVSNLSGLNLDFLLLRRPEEAAGHLFFDNTHQAVRETPEAQIAIRRLDLNYYIPCTVQNRNVAVLGLGKTMEGDFLSSEDVELLQTLAGYIGIAIQNARLYASLEQKVMEYERLKDFNENIVESISVGVLAVDLEDRIEFWNSQMEVMFALPRSEAVGRPINEVFPAAFSQEFYRIRQHAGVHNLYKFRLETGADARIANIAIAPLVSRRFHVIGRLIIVDDITERMALESQLTQAEKLSSIGLLAAGVAHEVNTPLAVISSYAQMLAKQLTGDDRKSSLLEKITRQTFRASEIVNNLLNFSRTGGGEFADVDLNQIIRETLALVEHQLSTSRIRIVQDLTSDLPRIHGNTGKLQQVFLNLVLNARDAMPSGGTLTVRTRNGSGANVAISDTGTGIAPEHLSRIYDPFFTTKTAPRQGERRGTGLGLAVTYGIIQEHAGKIWVESEAGQGTTFFLEFPMVRKAVHV
ncbi:MAG: GAF domain-containing protein [Acidobacteria bacterium]|nr:GAF domain-containing protein [Acidobacteriota bacterium]